MSGRSAAPRGAAAIAIHPLTPARWGDLEALFGPRGACGGCWCMYWRLGSSEFRAAKGEDNRKAFAKLVKAGAIPGLLAYVDDKPVGWCAFAPREQYPRLATARTLKPLDDRPVWSVSCFFIARGHRRKGLTVQLLEAAKGHVKARGGTLLEGYPSVPGGQAVDAFAWTGLVGAFEKAGFAVAAKPSKSRAIVRFDLSRKS
jgi:GNAT superfamily N-acetyltransferase